MGRIRDQYEELFGPVDPYDPIEAGPFSQPVPQRGALPIPTEGGAEPTSTADDELLRTLRQTNMPTTPEDPEGVGFTDYGKQLGAGAVDVGALGAGALEYGARQAEAALDEGFARDVTGAARRFLGEGRQALTGVAEDITASMSPEAQRRLQEQFLTLDPNNSVWRGGVGEAVSTIGLKFSRALPATVATLLPAKYFFRAGATPGAMAYIGASETALSMGGIANGIAQEIEQTPAEQLYSDSDRFRQLMGEYNDEEQAKQQLIAEAQGAAPLVGGAMVGAISGYLGRYLEPVFTDGAGFARRFGTGFKLEAMQESPQSALEQLTQNYAARVYDADRLISQGVGEAATEGAIIGGLTGGGFTAAAGRGPQRTPPPDAPTAAEQDVPGPDTPQEQRGSGIPLPPLELRQQTPEDFETPAPTLDEVPDDRSFIEQQAERYPEDAERFGIDISEDPIGPDIRAASEAAVSERTRDLFPAELADDSQRALIGAGPAQRGQTQQAAENLAVAQAAGQQGQQGLPLEGGGPRQTAVAPIPERQPRPLTETEPLPFERRARQGKGLPEGMVAGPGGTVQQQDVVTQGPVFDPTEVEDLLATPEEREAAGQMRLDEEPRRVEGFERRPARAVTAREMGTRAQKGFRVLARNDDGEEVYSFNTPDVEEANDRADRWATEYPDLNIAVVPVRGTLPRTKTATSDVRTIEEVRRSEQEDQQRAAAGRRRVPEEDRAMATLQKGIPFEERPEAIGKRAPKTESRARARVAGSLMRRAEREGRQRIRGFTPPDRLDFRAEIKRLQSQLRALPDPDKAETKQQKKKLKERRKRLERDIARAEEFAARTEDRYRQAWGTLVENEVRQTEGTPLTEEQSEARQQALSELAQVRRIAKPKRKLAAEAERARRAAPEEVEEAARTSRLADILRDEGYDEDVVTNDIEEIDADELEQLSRLAFETSDVIEGTSEDIAAVSNQAKNRIDDLFEQAIEWKAGKTRTILRNIAEDKKGDTTLTDEQAQELLEQEIGEENVTDAELKKLQQMVQSVTGLSAEEVEAITSKPEPQGEETQADVEEVRFDDGRIVPDETFGRNEYLGRVLETGIGDVLTALRETYGGTPGQKMKLIRRAVAQRQYRAAGGQAQKGLQITAQTVGEQEADTKTKRGRRKSGFTVGEMLVEKAPQDESRADRQKRLTRAAETRSALDEAITKASNFLRDAFNTKEFRALREQRNADGSLTDDATNMIHGRAFFRSIHQFAKAMRDAAPTGNAAINEMERLTKWLNRVTEYKAKKFANQMGRAMEAELRESRMLIRAEPELRGLTLDETRRTKSLAESNAANSARLALARRIEQVYPNNLYYKKFVGPLIRKFSRSTVASMKEGVLTPLGQEVANKGFPTYVPTPEELEGLAFAMDRWRQTERTFEDLYKPVRTYFVNLGFKFDDTGSDRADGPLVLERNEDGKAVYHHTDKILEAKFRASGIPEEQPPAGAAQLGDPELMSRLKQSKAAEEEVVRGLREERTETVALREDQAADLQNAAEQQEILGIIDRFKERINKSKTTIQGLIRAEERLIRALKARNAWQDHPSPTMGKVKVAPGKWKVYRMVGDRLKSKKITKPRAKELMNMLNVPDLTQAQRELLRSYPGIGETRVQRTLERARTTQQQDEIDFFLEAIDPVGNDAEFETVATEIGNMLAAQRGPVGMNTLLDSITENLPVGHPHRIVAERLRALNLNTPVQYDWNKEIGRRDEDANKSILGQYRHGRGEPRILINNRLLEEYRRRGSAPNVRLVHAVIHEGVHAATNGALELPDVREAMQGLQVMARQWLKDSGIKPYQYGLREQDPVEEFIAEAFSNLQFQRLLKGMRIREISMWDRFKQMVMRIIGRGSEPETVYDAVMMSANELFTGMPQSSRSTRLSLDLEITDPTMRSVAGEYYNRLDQTTGTLRSLWQRGKQRSLRSLLPVTSMEQIRDVYAEHFQDVDGRNTLREYMDNFFKRNAYNAQLMEKAEKMIQKWTEKQADNRTIQTPQGEVHTMVELSRVMTEASLFKVAVREPLSSDANAHITTDKAKAAAREIKQRFDALPDDVKQFYGEVQSYYKETLREETRLHLENALRGALASGPDPLIDEADFDKLFTQEYLQNASAADIRDKLAPIEGLTENVIDEIFRIARIPEMRQGDYFPLMRYGEFVVFSEKELESKTFDDKDEATNYAKTRRADDPTLTVNLRKPKEGMWVVDVSVKEFVTNESQTEAAKARDELIARYGAENVSTVQRKIDFNPQSAIASNRGLTTILNNLSGNPAAQNAIRQFYLRSLADSSFRKHEITRQNRRGVDYDVQHRNFANYAKTSAYYTSQLKFGSRMATALADMGKFIRGHRDESEIATVQLNYVREELEKRDQMTSGNYRDVNKYVRRFTEFGQFMYLTSASYWMVNASQPWLVTLPWMAARFGWGRSAAALRSAQSMIAHPLVKEAINSKGGLEALRSKIAAEKAFNVLDQVYEYMEGDLGAEQAGEYKAMLEDLRNHSVIDLSWIAELRDISEGQNLSANQKVLDASRIMAHLTEVNNRILTAIAAYDLKLADLGTSMPREQAVREATEFAKSAVSTTQFNYSGANKPRLFSPNGPLGPAAPLMFQFLQWPQHMYAMLFMNMAKAARGDKEALKTLVNVTGTHVAVGGLIGAALQPIKIAFGMAFAAADLDDEWGMKEAISGETFDTMIRKAAAEGLGTELGGVIAKGLPYGLLKTDLSDRMSMGTVYFLDLRTETAESTLGSIVGGVGGPLVNTGINWMKGMQDVMQGNYYRGAERSMPKFLRDFMRAYRYSEEGLTNNNGDVMRNTEDFTPYELFLQSLGFAPSAVSDVYEKQSLLKRKEGTYKDRKQSLMRRYRTATSGEERAEIRKEIGEHNKTAPRPHRITRSSLLRTVQGRRERERAFSRYGANISDVEAAIYGEDTEYFPD